MVRETRDSTAVTNRTQLTVNAANITTDDEFTLGNGSVSTRGPQSR